MFGSWALDYVVPREVRANFLRELDTNLSMGRKECLANFGEEHCQKIEMAANSLGKTWAKTTRKVEAALGREGQFDAYLDVFNQELTAAVEKSAIPPSVASRRNPRPEKSRPLKVGDLVWVSSGHKIESGTLKKIFPGYGDEKHRRMEVSVPGKWYEQTVDTSETDVWPTEAEAIAARTRSSKLRKRWTDDIDAQEAAELLAIEHDYRADFFKQVNLMEEGHEHFRAIKKFGKAYAKKTGIQISPDEGDFRDQVGVTVTAIMPKLQSMEEAKEATYSLLMELNRLIGGDWRVTDLAIDSKVERAIHDDELEERYGKDLRKNPKKKVAKKTKAKAKAKAKAKPIKRRDSMVSKNAWWYEDCPTHGLSPHLSVIGGLCSKCQAEKLELADKDYKPARFRRPSFRYNPSSEDALVLATWGATRASLAAGGGRNWNLHNEQGNRFTTVTEVIGRKVIARVQREHPERMPVEYPR